jgi:hypothetical protein
MPARKAPPPPLATAQFGYNIVPRKDAKQRVLDAREFLELGKKEIAKGEGTAEDKLVREGAEKVFHALVEAAAARIQKYGLGIPDNHGDIRDGLYAASPDLMKVFDEVFADLHTLTYYKGWIDRDRIQKSVEKVEKAITEIEKSLKY